MRHLVPLLVAVLALVGTAAGVDLLSAGGAGPGHVWLLTRGPAGAAMARVLRTPDAVLLDAWAGGRVLLLRVPRRDVVAWPADAVMLRLRLPPAAVVLAGCG